MKKIQSILIFAFVPLLFYPVYFAVSNLIDSLFGDQQLINWLFFDSRSLLIKVFFSDWLDSLPIMYAISFIVLTPLKLVLSLIDKYSLALITICGALIMAVSSSMIGFEGIGLLNNVACMILFSVIFHITIQLSKFKSNENI